MKVTDTALLGRAGTRYLEAVSLSDLWTSSTGVFIQSRVSGTFCSQAYGAGNKELVGIWLQVAYVVLFAVCIFVAAAWALTGPVLRAFGKSGELSGDAAYFAVVLMLCLPVRIGFSQLTTFLASQKIMRPGVVCATFGMAFNLIFGLVLVLGIPIPGWDGLGFPACPWITTAMEYAQLAILLYVFCHRQQLHRECWPGWSFEHITARRVKSFLGQYLPGSLSTGSDFWRVAVIGAVADTMGDIDVAVWSASYRICWISLTFLGSIARAMGIKIGQDLGAGRAADAKRITMIGICLAVSVISVLSLAVVCAPRLCGRLFSNDPAVLDLFEEVRFPLAAFMASMNLGTMLETIPVALGRTSSVFYAGLIGSWVGQVPCVLLCTKYWRADLVGLYTGVALGYALLVVLLGLLICTIDWSQVAEEARVRSEVAQQPQTSISMEPTGEEDAKQEREGQQ
uniref:Protein DETOXIFICATION n=1 Tax=Alexandrium catenella TaxID=2925 RepID=A0A7S1KYX5_ALECA